MKKIHPFLIFMSLLICIPLSARENPFEAVNSPDTNTHLDDKTKEAIFDNFDFKLPSTARILKGIKVLYQNIDGSVEEQEFSINKSIDWHYPLTLNQSNAHLNENADYVAADKIIFFSKSNKLYITANRQLERDFILPEPFRIILDFQKDSSDRDREIALDQKYFSKITLTKYDNFYRVAIVLDGHYKYTIQKTNDGYQVTLK